MWACDEKRGALHRKEGDGNESTREKEARKANRIWLDRVRDDIIEKRLSVRKCTTVLHGGVCHCTSTPHKSGNKMKRKKKAQGVMCDEKKPIKISIKFM